MRVCKHCGIDISQGSGTAAQGLQCEVCRNGVRRYGLNRLQQESLWRLQDCKCALCGSTDYTLFAGKGKSVVVDHCHTTGEVRGLLCPTCNTMLGKIEGRHLSGDDMMERIDVYRRRSEMVA